MGIRIEATVASRPCFRPSFTMVATHPSRVFRSGDASTLYVTIPADVVSDSQFPFEADQAVVVAIEGDRLVVTPEDGGTQR